MGEMVAQHAIQVQQLAVVEEEVSLRRRDARVEVSDRGTARTAQV